MKTILEIGANRGIDTELLLRDNPDAIIYAFEPTQELLINHLWPKFKNNPMVKIIPMAVDIDNSFKNFNVAGHADWGCSSLHAFSEEGAKKFTTQYSRNDLFTTHQYFVPTITLLDFCNLYKIKQIDYLWIDTQGNDFNCLLSLGDAISIVKAGKCEVASQIELYKDTNNKIDTVVNWLSSKGFNTSTQQSLNEPEVDLHFIKI